MARRRSGDKQGDDRQGGDRAEGADAGRFSYEGLDRVMHEKARLGILASLAANSAGLLFNDLKQLCSLTDGNLSRHLTVLSEAGLVEDLKTAQGGRTQTAYRLTAAGRRRFAEYLSVLEAVVSDARKERLPRRVKGRRAESGGGAGWATGRTGSRR